MSDEFTMTTEELKKLVSRAQAELARREAAAKALSEVKTEEDE